MKTKTHMNAMFAARVSKQGRYHFGDGLYLQVKPGSKSWEFRFTLNKRTRHMGLGPFPLFSLADAREALIEQKRVLHSGRDPIEVRENARRGEAAAHARTMTFDECARQYIAAKRDGWKNAKHASQWESTLNLYASPVIGQLAVQSVDTALVMKVIEPIWREKTETANRLRNRIELVIDWATVRGFRSGDNPARWKGHLDNLLPKRTAVSPVKHFEAMPYQELPPFMEKLRSIDETGARALEFNILTAARSGETLGATWDEFDFGQRVWTIPAARMKAKRVHRVPLSDRAIAILEHQRVFSDHFVFPGRKPGRPLSNMTMTKFLRDQGLSVTTHGFRSTFSVWRAECTVFTRDLAEEALAHTLKDKVEAAYRRTDLLERRRALMSEFERFCAGKGRNAEVFELHPRASVRGETS